VDKSAGHCHAFLNLSFMPAFWRHYMHDFGMRINDADAQP